MTSRRRYGKPEIVRAVHEDDLEGLLRSLGILQPLLAGTLQCAVCGKVVTMSAVGCILPQQDKVVVSCDSPECCAAVGRQTRRA